MVALAAVIVLWCAIGRCLWLLRHAAATGFERPAGWSGTVLVVGLGILLSSFIWLALRQMERMRQAAEARVALQSLIADHASEAMMLTDRAQRILSVNSAFETITGYPARHR
mgnify:CR=1 FL=1